jgi:hypothetical protein
MIPLRRRRGAGIPPDCEAIARLRPNHPDFFSDMYFPAALSGTQLPIEWLHSLRRDAEVVKFAVMPNDARLRKSFRLKVSSIQRAFKLG